MTRDTADAGRLNSKVGRAVLPASLVGSLLLGPVLAQTPPAQRAIEGDATAVTAVVVDVVVRDKDGNPVTGLEASDFEISEDGTPQEIGSFTPVNRPLADQPAAPPPVQETAAPQPSAAPEVIALVFDRLSPEAKALAHKAALQYIGDGKVARNITAIFGIELSLVFHQPFTRDADLLRKGLDAVIGRSSVAYANTSEAQAAAREQAARSAAQTDAIGAGGPGTGTANVGSGMGDAQFAAMQARMMESFEGLERDQQGYATSNGLLAIVSAMRAIPGRKSVVFFSEGLQIPPNVQSQFTSVIDAANRANVSIYPMDAGGLRTDSLLKETREGINAAAESRLAWNPSRDISDRPMMEALERNEDLLRANPHSGLGMLADQTGGFLIANSNDLRDGFGRIDTDMRHYYVLTYVPKNTTFDGRFRTIDVKVKRPGVRVRSRKGYYAVRTPASGAPVLGYEAPALAILDKTPVPNAFPARAMALRFPEPGRPGLVPVIVSVPTAGITFRPAEDKKTYTSDFIVVVRFKNEQGDVLDKMSQRYQLQGPIEQMERAKLGDVLFYREPVLVPGVYSMEVAVYDAFSGKATVRLATVDVPAVPEDALRLSSVIAIQRSEKVPEDERIPGSPLYVGEQLLYPSLGEPLSKASVKELPFYFVVYPGRDSSPLKATLELNAGGRTLAQAPLALAKPDASGRIPQVSRIPVEALPPGTYELRVSVQQGQQTVARSLTFRLVP